MRAAHARRLLTVLALGSSVLLLAACGESEAEKAKAQVCHARTQIEKEVASLQSLPLSTSAISTAKTSFETILTELGKIKEAEPKLEPAIKSQVESAQSSFKSSVLAAAGELVTGLSSPEKAAAKFKSAVEKLGEEYKHTLKSIDCS